MSILAKFWADRRQAALKDTSRTPEQVAVDMSNAKLRVTSRPEWSNRMPHMQPAPHDKSLLELQYGMNHQRRLTAVAYCDVIRAYLTDKIGYEQMQAVLAESAS